MTERFDIRARAGSFIHAFRGMGLLVVHEHNARIHLFATIVIAGLGLWLRVDREAWVALLFAMALVWVAEALNTAVEALADAVHPEPHPLVGRAKDVAAGGVLIAAIASASVGLLVLGPPLWAKLVS